jgi:hypothetical protein
MQPIHPFPARMAPELSRELLGGLPPGSRVIDPMCGSGTVVRQAVEAGHFCVGRDLDPLAVLMTRAWVTPIDTDRLMHDAQEVVCRAQAINSKTLRPPWNDDATESFARYWFAPDQLNALNRLSSVLKTCRYHSRDVLRVCFSRLVITKEKGASLARDVSHSRPHRVATSNDFDVFQGFLRAVRLVANRLEPARIVGHATVEVGDARELHRARDGRFDAAMTSPPYLNAIDYLRGHRLSLIWFGRSVEELQRIRARSIGAERILLGGPIDVSPFIDSSDGRSLPERYRGWVRRYAVDISHTLAGLRSIVRPGGSIMLVVGNSLIRGAAVDNAGIIITCASAAGLVLEQVNERSIPARRRYLPPPSEGSPLSRRMRSECVITLKVPSS